MKPLTELANIPRNENTWSRHTTDLLTQEIADSSSRVAPCTVIIAFLESFNRSQILSNCPVQLSKNKHKYFTSNVQYV